MNYGATFTFMLVEEGSLLCCLGRGWAGYQQIKTSPSTPAVSSASTSSNGKKKYYMNTVLRFLTFETSIKLAGWRGGAYCVDWEKGMDWLLVLFTHSIFTINIIISPEVPYICWMWIFSPIIALYWPVIYLRIFCIQLSLDLLVGQYSNINHHQCWIFSKKGSCPVCIRIW